MIPITIILTWFYRRSGGSIQTTVLFHASMNTIPFGLPYFPPAWAVIFLGDLRNRQRPDVAFPARSRSGVIERDISRSIRAGSLG